MKGPGKERAKSIFSCFKFSHVHIKCLNKYSIICLYLQNIYLRFVILPNKCQMLQNCKSKKDFNRKFDAL